MDLNFLHLELFSCVLICVFLLVYRSKTYLFEEFLFTWQDRLRKLEQPTAMSVKLQGEVDKYKVDSRTVDGIACDCLFFSLSLFIIEEQGYKSQGRSSS